MKKHFSRIEIACVFLLAGFLQYCASVTAPTGGGKDNVPPQLIAEKSTPNLQTEFTKQPIVLIFDEWVKLQDVYNQVVVSPPIEGSPDIRIRKKSVIFEFPEAVRLRDSATYIVNFGEAVQDITESNPAENLRYVFSTGTFIDSLSLQMDVVDAFTGEPVEGVLVMLYDQLDDSVVYRELPFYFATSRERGRVELTNLREGTFKLFAQIDAGKKYLYEAAGEPMAFREEPVAITDTTAPVVLLLSRPRGELRLKDRESDTYGRLELTFSDKPPALEVFSRMDEAPDYLREWRGDTTLVLWYDADTLETWEVLLRSDTTLRDTLSIRIPDREAFMESAQLRVESRATKEGDLNPSRPLWLEFNHPIVELDTAAARLLEDTTLLPVKGRLEKDSLNPRRLNLTYRWKKGMSYRLVIPPDALRDLYGLQPADTLNINFLTNLRKNYGTFDFSFENAPADTTYLLTLLLDEKEVASFSVQAGTDQDRSLKALPVGQYQLRVITDLNQNRRWDPGSYAKKRQPEPIVTRNLQQLRANWIVDVHVDFNDLESGEAQNAEEPTENTRSGRGK
jgi:hypothetical protein